MKAVLFAVAMSVLLLVIVCDMSTTNADPIDIIDVTMEYFGPLEDINHDGDVDYLDASSLVSHYGESGPPGWLRDDINDDGVIDYLDASAFVSVYGLHWLVP